MLFHRGFVQGLGKIHGFFYGIYSLAGNAFTKSAGFSKPIFSVPRFEMDAGLSAA